MTEDDFLKAISIVDRYKAINEIYQDILLFTDYGKNLYKVNAEQKVVFLITRLESEVYNGGIDQYFYNSSGEYSHETLNALKLINAPITLKILEKAISYWPNSTVPKETSIRREELLDTVEKKAESEWEKLTKAYWDDEENLFEKLFQFILDNSIKFY
ncbi:MAG: DMP19 family protein [Bacteroidota bacterium]